MHRFLKKKGRLAQLVQSICLTSRGSAVRIRQRPHYQDRSQRSFLLSNILQSSKQITLRFKNWKEQIVGYLHDAAEDTPHTVSETIHLLQDKCPNIATKDWEEIETALNLMNSHTAANREAYINRFRNNTLAIIVKLNDLRHNMDISRIPNPTEKDIARAARYRREYSQLKKMLE